MSSSFQGADYKNLQFPTKMYVDYVRIYQRRGIKNGVTCDPPNRPTTDYIARYLSSSDWKNGDDLVDTTFVDTWRHTRMLISRHGHKLTKHSPGIDCTTAVINSYMQA